MLAKTYSASLLGIDAFLVEIEVDVSGGLPYTSIVGLPDNAIKESKERVKSAIKNSGFEFPTRRITVNLAPADIRKEGSAYDLPIALGIMAASGQLSWDTLKDFIILGELSLNGNVRRVSGILPMAIEARRLKKRGVIVPRANANEAAVVEGLKVYPAKSLSEVVDFLQGEKSIERYQSDQENFFHSHFDDEVDFADVKGQEHVKRALEVAAAGGHNALLLGPPGGGKTMLSRRIPTIIPALTLEESLETTKVHSAMGLLSPREPLVRFRPFRAPHHTASYAGLIGGGSFPRPGEVSLAHNGILFLDELPEFPRSVLEVLRQPLEDGVVTISRASYSLTFPARFMLVAAMNPCPCGYLGHPQKACACTTLQVQKYISRISGPLLDRIDIHVEVAPVKYAELTRKYGEEEKSSTIRNRVEEARIVQRRRFATDGIFANAQMGTRQLNRYCAITEEGSELLKRAITKLGMSARAYSRILKVSRTIADLADSENIEAEHISEAIQYRSLDRGIL